MFILYGHGGIFMRKISAIYILLLLITPTSSLDQSSELIQLANILLDQSLEVDKWTVTVKEQMSSDQAIEKIGILEDEYVIKEIEDKKTFKYLFEKKVQSAHISLSFAVTIPKEKQYTAELVATIEGIDLEENTLKSYEKTLHHIQNTLFTASSKVFTCLTSINGDIISSDVFLRNMSKILELKYVSTQTEVIEETLHNETLYGYTTLWENRFLLNDNPLNVQIVVQSDENEKQKVIIGTPILITEY